MEGQKEWNSLTESERLEIIKLAALTNNHWKRIGETIGRNPETCKKFFYSYKKYNTIFPKQGRPKKVDDETEQNIVNSMRNNPLQTLRDVAEENNVSKPTAKTVLNDNKIKYYRMTPVAPLDQSHKNNRLSMCDIILSYQYSQLPPIIFTDESTVCEDLNKGGIWREWGHHPPESFYIKDQRPLSLMIWGELALEVFVHRSSFSINMLILRLI